MSTPRLTPFGPTQLNAGMLATHLLAENCPQGLAADKWELLRHCIAAKKRLNVSDRALTVLSALLSCYPQSELRAGDSLIVFPSNRELARRAHGISEPTLRRALAQLVAAQVLVRRDSPNGKRYARRDAQGEVTRVFGFDLKPLLAQSARIGALAEQVRAQDRLVRDLREQITLLRRDMEKGFALAEAEGRAGALKALHEAYRAIPTQNMRGLGAEELEARADALLYCRTQMTKRLTKHIISINMNANDHHIERHKQDSNPNPIAESEGSGKSELEETCALQPSTPETAVKSTKATNDPAARTSGRPPTALPLPTILEACPDLADYTTSPITTWSAFIEAGKLARGALGISPSAWDEAAAAMGLGEAAITVATILQRQSEINSPGGYLRALSAKAAAGKFSPQPIIQALLRRNLNQMAGLA